MLARRKAKLEVYEKVLKTICAKSGELREEEDMIRRIVYNMAREREIDPEDC